MTELMLLLRTLTACYVSVMNVQYTVSVRFEDMEEDIMAAAEVEPDYLTATVVYDLDMLAVEPDYILRQTVVHELVHIMTWELVEVAETVDLVLAWRLWEQFITRVEHWPIWLGMCTEAVPPSSPGR